MPNASRSSLTGGPLVAFFFFAYVLARIDAIAYIEAGGANGYIHVNARAIQRYCMPVGQKHRWMARAVNREERVAVPGGFNDVDYLLERRPQKGSDSAGAYQLAPSTIMDWDDAKQEVRHWLLQAASRYDPFKGAKFSTWCMVHIKLKMRNLLSRVKKETAQWRAYRTAGLHGMYAERRGATAPPSVSLAGDDKAVWDAIVAAKDSWHRHITKNGISKKWKGDPAKLIAARTGIPVARVSALFERIRDAEPEEALSEPAHARNGIRQGGRIFA